MNEDSVSSIPAERNEARAFQDSCTKGNMAHKKSIGLPLAVLLLSSLGAAVGQAPASRINGDWRSSDAVTIPASVPPAVTSSVVVGAAPSGTQLERMILLLEPSAAQQQALATELSNQQDSTSPEYRHWLTPSACRGIQQLFRRRCHRCRLVAQPGVSGCSLAGRPGLDRVFRHGWPA
jgi:hypothetical protein